MKASSPEDQRAGPDTFPLQDLHLWIRHGEGYHQTLLARANELEDGDPELVEVERTLAETSNLDWDLTPSGIIQADLAGEWIAKYLLKPTSSGEPIVPNGMFDGGYTSPAHRAEQTAAICLLAAKRVLGRSVIELDENEDPKLPIDLRLREINLGEAIGMTKRAYREAHPDNVARRRAEPLLTAYMNGSTIPEHMDLTIRSLYTTLGRDAIHGMHTTLGRDAERRGSRSAFMSTHGRTVRSAALTIRRDHPDDFDRIEREEEVKNATMFMTRRTPGSPGFNQYAFVTPWILGVNGEIILNDTPPNFVEFKAPSSRPYRDMLRGLPPSVVAKLLAEHPGDI